SVERDACELDRRVVLPHDPEARTVARHADSSNRALEMRASVPRRVGLEGGACVGEARTPLGRRPTRRVERRVGRCVPWCVHGGIGERAGIRPSAGIRALTWTADPLVPAMATCEEAKDRRVSDEDTHAG